jgi:hypothetical protein
MTVFAAAPQKANIFTIVSQIPKKQNGISAKPEKSRRCLFACAAGSVRLSFRQEFFPTSRQGEETTAPHFSDRQACCLC